MNKSKIIINLLEEKKPLHQMTDDEIKAAHPKDFKKKIKDVEVIRNRRIKGGMDPITGNKIKTATKKPSRTLTEPQQLLNGVISATAAKVEPVSAGVTRYTKDSKGKNLDITIDTTKKLVTIKSIPTNDLFPLMQSAEKLKYKIKR